MTHCFPPLIKPDGRFSRIRLAEFLASWPKAARPAWDGNSRTFLALIAPRGRHPFFVALPAVQHAPLISSDEHLAAKVKVG